MNLSTGIRTDITKGPNEYGAIPTFNSDGTKITYARWFYNNQSKTYSNPEIVIKNLLTEKIEVVIDDQYENWRPVFSPNNNSIVFISKENGNFDLFLYDITVKKIISVNEYII